MKVTCISLLLLLNALILLLLLIWREKNALIDLLFNYCQDLEDELATLKSR